MSLLTIVQKSAKQTRLLDAPASVIGNNDPAIEQMLELLFETGEEIKEEYLWQVLVKEGTFNTAASDEDYPLSTVISDGDFDRFVGDTFWNRTTNRENNIVDYVGWQFLKSSINSSAGIDKVLTLYNDIIYVYPTPTAVESFYFFYRSSQWITSSGGTGQDEFLADTDLIKFPEYLLQLGLTAKMLKAYGVPYEDAYLSYTNRLNLEAEKNTLPQRIYKPMFKSGAYGNIPDTGFGS